jgi:uncharacterized protein (TIGR00730 family)
MAEIKNICVFCGSQQGSRAIYIEQAQELGKILVKRNMSLVYGGGRVGLMGIIADTVLASGGKVTGVIPELLAKKELLHTQLTRLEVVDSMHTRKATMAELSEAFIAMPGGFGTFDELFEMITWNQLGIHMKPIGLLNVGGYFDIFLKLVKHATTEGYIEADDHNIFVVDSEPKVLLSKLENYGSFTPVLEKLKN